MYVCRILSLFSNLWLLKHSWRCKALSSQNFISQTPLQSGVLKESTNKRHFHRSGERRKGKVSIWLWKLWQAAEQTAWVECAAAPSDSSISPFWRVGWPLRLLLQPPFNCSSSRCPKCPLRLCLIFSLRDLPVVLHANIFSNKMFLLKIPRVLNPEL